MRPPPACRAASHAAAMPKAKEASETERGAAGTRPDGAQRHRLLCVTPGCPYLAYSDPRMFNLCCLRCFEYNWRLVGKKRHGYCCESRSQESRVHWRSATNVQLRKGGRMLMQWIDLNRGKNFASHKSLCCHCWCCCLAICLHSLLFFVVSIGMLVFFCNRTPFWSLALKCFYLGLHYLKKHCNTLTLSYVHTTFS